MTHSNDERRATAASTHRRGGARHDHKTQYMIDLHLEKTRRLALHLHMLDLYPSDRDLLIRLQGHIKVAKIANNYDPQITLSLFDS